MTSQAYCPYCEQTVAAVSMLTDSKLWPALENDADVEVMHVSPDGDHRWNLNYYEKEHLRKKHTEGLI